MDPKDTRLALEQLNDAIRLFLRKRYVSALTLAGAAEAILSGTMKAQGAKNWLQEEFEIIDIIEQHYPLFDIYSSSQPDKKRRKAFYKHKNRLYDLAKHGTPTRNTNDPREMRERTASVSFEDAAQDMIVRACEDARRLGLSLPQDVERFDAWFYEEVVGLP